MIKLFDNYLDAMEQVIFEVADIDNKVFKKCAGDSLWYKELLPMAAKDDSFTVDDHVPFLEDFLFDAMDVWQGKVNSKIRSGLWTEVTASGETLHLEATAIKQGSYLLLVLTNQCDEFAFRQNTLQSARELLLSNDKLVEQNSYIHSRLLSILNTTTNSEKAQSALNKAIENADFSILITDNNFASVVENKAAHELFSQDLDIKKGKSRPIDVFKKLMKAQLPEFERILETKSTWTGELCWMSPPSTLKWLKVSLYPVKDDLNDVKNWILFANDISNIKFLVQRNEQLSLHDMLTDLPNRFSFWQTLEKRIDEGTPFYLVYLDINEFRRYNEFFGHEEGDQLLVEVSGRLRSTLKQSDYVARVGGDQFGIILSGIAESSVCKQAIQRVIEIVTATYVSSRSDSIHISVSAGAANYPTDAQCVEEVVKFVDLSTFSGKGSKKNSIQFYTQEMKDVSRENIVIEQELRSAIQHEEFELNLQPIIDLESKKVVKAEALIRWKHPTKGMISPAIFIPIAEKSELIIKIGYWVIDHACFVVKSLCDNGHRIKVSMNLSPNQVYDKNLFAYLQSTIRKYEVDPKLLELEVTEGVLVDDSSNTNTLLHKVRAIGMSVSVDDFGTGYSSLAYLKKLPLDYLKIDQSFVKDIAIDDNDKAIVKAVIGMAHNLNLGVIAEGVETQEQLTFLKQNACNSVQGYLFSRPITLPAFLTLLKEQPE